MSEQRHRSEADLDRDEAAFVRRIAESYRPAEPSPAQRVAFRAGLDAKIQRRPTRGLWTAAASAVAIALTLVVLRAESPVAPSVAPPPTVARGDAGVVPGDDVMLVALAMTNEGDDDEDTSLPDDYVAIADLFLEGV